jgi:hypothetical protein
VGLELTKVSGHARTLIEGGGLPDQPAVQTQISTGPPTVSCKAQIPAPSKTPMVQSVKLCIAV